MNAITTSIRRSAIGLGLFAVITGGTIALTGGITKDRIRNRPSGPKHVPCLRLFPNTSTTTICCAMSSPCPPTLANRVVNRSGPGSPDATASQSA